MQQQHDIVKPWNLNKKYTKLLLNCFKESINLRIQYIMDVIGYTNFLRFEIATNMNLTTHKKDIWYDSHEESHFHTLVICLTNVFESEPSLPGASYNDTRLVCKTLICCSEDDSTLFPIDFQQIPNKSLEKVYNVKKRIWGNAEMFWQFLKLKISYLKVKSNEWYLWCSI